jgi:hypothetical protein
VLTIQSPRNWYRIVACLGVVVIVGFWLLLGHSQVSAHPGGLDAKGCHMNRNTGDYHCHRTQVAPEPPSTQKPGTSVSQLGTSSLESGPVKKSSSGICHAPGSAYYGQTQRFTPYVSLEACLTSGGMPPKR